MKVYLDVCCFCRPYDDKTSERIRLEADAVLSIFERCKAGELILLGSVALDEEISYIGDDEKRGQIISSLSLIHQYVEIDAKVLTIMQDYQLMGLHTFDALHCACATKGNAIFLTTDDYITKTIRKQSPFGLYACNPVTWIMEANDENNQ
ncbi:MAG TPA: PIN domain-containing protein [Methanospirillum sp.]|uniref:PIN domain-containing protein n=1 Tax=Methanospirillum sp. TaxID=45200 RepID=UPI002C3DA720|nr:PIN domain-containing protein [Methanospirillum sp.]HWQ62873.1 PIN domain-containing protein [Methanospirillum sp.]